MTRTHCLSRSSSFGRSCLMAERRFTSTPEAYVADAPIPQSRTLGAVLGTRRASRHFSNLWFENFECDARLTFKPGR